MATEVKRGEIPAQPPQLVEMSWDPITRIVGSLGIYTKIDFKNRKVAECHSTSSCAPCAALTRVCHAGCICTWAREKSFR
jgi:hypothetical protein